MLRLVPFFYDYCHQLFPPIRALKGHGFSRAVQRSVQAALAAEGQRPSRHNTNNTDTYSHPRRARREPDSNRCIRDAADSLPSHEYDDPKSRAGT
jgi:hypothetical protein